MVRIAPSLSTWVLGVVLSGLIAAWITLAWPTIRKFCALPPQRLSLWILKARIVGVESRISVTASIRKDLRVLALSCFWTLFRWGLRWPSLCTANTYFAVVTLGKAAHVADTHQIFFLGDSGLGALDSFHHLRCSCHDLRTSDLRCLRGAKRNDCQTRRLGLRGLMRSCARRPHIDRCGVGLLHRFSFSYRSAVRVRNIPPLPISIP